MNTNLQLNWIILIRYTSDRFILLMEGQKKKPIKIIQKKKYKLKKVSQPSQCKYTQSLNRQVFEESQEYTRIEQNYQRDKYETKKKENEFNSISRKSEKREQPQKEFNGQKKYQAKCSPSELELIEDLIDTSDIRRLKRFYKECFPKAERIVLKYQVTKPIVFFETINNSVNQLIHIRDILNSNSDFKKQRKLVEKVFEACYPNKKVNKRYFSICIFGVEMAKEKRLRFYLKDLLGENRNHYYRDYSIFYCVKQSKVNFIMLDQGLNTVEFNTNFIENYKKDHPREYRLYQKFVYEVIEKNSVGDLYNEDRESEQDDIDQEQRQDMIRFRKDFGPRKLLEKISRIAEKDLSEFIDQIQEKQNELQILNEQNKVDEAEMITDEIREKNWNVENFEKIRDDVLKRIGQENRNNKEVLLPCLKRLIIAEKQLLSQLPIISRKREIFEKLNKNSLLILEGETGSGKSTQLPQMLCEYYNIFHDPKALPVIVTQPRKLATRTLAERVASEMEEEVHGFVDYQTSIRSKVNPNAKIIFKMDRFVLNELIEDELLSKYCCLVIDEAHERTINIDIILGLIKNLLAKRKDFKVIVTSASMDIELFSRYFNTEILKVSGRMFPVEEIFKPYPSRYELLSKMTTLFDEQLLNEGNLKTKYKGHILVFCSGLEQIQKLSKHFKIMLNPRIFKVLKLHGRLSPEEQKQVFNETSLHKVIFATRIAETSITIKGIKVIIDPGEDIEQQYDQKTKITSMKLKEISQSSAKKRAGLTGRTNEGFCFRLYSKEHKNKMPSYKLPQIKNMGLDTLVLRLKSLNIENVIQFPYLTPPEKQGLIASLQSLKMLGCINEQEKITQIGQLLIKLPIEPFLARSIIEAQIFMRLPELSKIVSKNVDLVSEVIGILCLVLNASNLFFIREDQREEADKNKFKQFSDEQGDFFFFQNIMTRYLQFKKTNDHSSLNSWMNENYIHKKTLSQAYDLYKQTIEIWRRFQINADLLKDAKIHCLKKINNCKTEKNVILSCLITSFAANLCLFSENENIGYTIISQKIPAKIYGTSILSIQGINPKWVVCYDLYQNDKNQTFFKVAQSVNFDFLIVNVHPYIIKKYDISSANKLNPYYRSFKKELPTLVFRSVHENYRKTRDQNPFFTKYNFIFHEDLNTIEIFFCQTVQQEKAGLLSKIDSLFVNKQFKSENSSEENPEKTIDRYIENYYHSFDKMFIYSFVGPIFLYLREGFEVLDINFKTTETCFKIQSTSEEALSLFEDYCSMYGNVEKNKGCLRFYVVEDENKESFKETQAYLVQYLQSQGIKIKQAQQIVDIRRKIPQSKLYLRFWAGQSDKGNIQLKFAKEVHKIDILHKRILEGISKKGKEKKQCCLTSARIQLTKKGDGINIYPVNPQKMRGRINVPILQNMELDEYEVYQELQKMNEEGYLGYGFDMPTMIKKFREPDLRTALRNDKEWYDQIDKLARKCGVSLQNSSIRIWGYYDKPRQQGPKQNAENNMRVDLHAEIKSFSITGLREFKEKYSGKKGILGTEKMHASFEYEQTAVVTTEKVFEALEDGYNYIVHQIKSQFPKLSVDNFKKKLRAVTKVFIRVRSSQREQLIEPARKLNSFFIPKLVYLEESKFRFLDKFDEGANIFDDLENQYNYQIYFAFNRYSKEIKLYSEDRLEKEIIEKLKERLSHYKYYEELISYRGKNLHKVIKQLDDLKKSVKELNDKSKFLSYEIIYQERNVRITADLQTFDLAKNAMLKLVSLDKGECDICCDLLQRPYRLYICEHTFCWLCLSSYIKQPLSQMSIEKLSCPRNCGEVISMYDVKTILSEEDFNKMCDIKISRFVEKRPEIFHRCFSINCQNIFLVKESTDAKSFQCDLCGKWYCLKCKQSHKGLTCEAWKSNISDEDLKKLGIRKCPKCGQRIQKNQGCQNMQCKTCNSHICWFCMQYFKTSPECYGHMNKQHGSFI